jgi:hypothetical protein
MAPEIPRRRWRSPLWTPRRDDSEGRLEEARARFDAAELGTFHWVQVPAIFWVMRGHLDLALVRAALAARDPGAPPSSRSSRC